MMLWLAGVASAATVAVLDFDGYGVSFSDAQTVTQGVRDAFLEGGTLDPLSGSDIADGVSKGQDDALRRARELVAEGRRLYTAGSATLAIDPLAEAVALHTSASSDVGRRPELADATFLQGLCLLKSGDPVAAKERFARAAFLVPRYAKERGTRMPSDAAALLAQAEDALARGPKSSRKADAIGRIAESLNVDFVVTGWVNAEGALTAKMYAGNELVSEAKVTLEERPPLPVDGAYGELVKLLGEAGLAAPEAEVAAEETISDEEAELLAAEDVVAKPRNFDEEDAATTKSRPTRIKTTGTVRYAERPITEQWWFWTGAVGVAGAGVFGVVYALTEPAPVYQEQPDGWTVTVVTE